MWNSGNDDWTSGNNISVVVDTAPYNIWSNWEAEKRDLYFLDINGNYYTQYNITPSEKVNDIKNTIYQMLSDYDNDSDLNTQSHNNNISLLNVYPNPFNPIINISFSQHIGNYMNMIIFDLNGETVKIFPNTYYSPGNYVLPWDASSLAAGIYIISFRSGIEIINKKIILAK